MVTKEQKAEIVSKFGKGAGDTGSAAVQAALLTARIKDLTPHFEKHKHDFHSKRGLMKLIGQRRRVLKRLASTDNEGYLKLIKELGIRK